MNKEKAQTICNLCNHERRLKTLREDIELAQKRDKERGGTITLTIPSMWLDMLLERVNSEIAEINEMLEKI